jgi:hypothetical protein
MISIIKVLIEAGLSDEDYKTILKSYDPRQSKNFEIEYERNPEKYEHIKSILPGSVTKIIRKMPEAIQ